MCVLLQMFMPESIAPVQAPVVKAAPPPPPPKPKTPPPPPKVGFLKSYLGFINRISIPDCR